MMRILTCYAAVEEIGSIQTIHRSFFSQLMRMGIRQLIFHVKHHVTPEQKYSDVYNLEELNAAKNITIS